MKSINRLLAYLALAAIFGILIVTGCTVFGGDESGPVELGSAGDFAVLAKTGITNVPSSDITGDIGLSPAAESFITGFAYTDATGYATSTQVTGRIYASDMADPTPAKMTAAIADMETAYTAAAGRSDTDFLNLGAGILGGLTLFPGVYTWGSNVLLDADVTVSGGIFDVWIFQVAGDLTVATGVQTVLSGGAKAGNIYWQVAGQTTLEAGAIFAGNILCKTGITMNAGASLHGRALAQSLVALNQNVILQP